MATQSEMVQGYPTPADILTYLADLGVEIPTQNYAPWHDELKQFVWTVANATRWAMSLSVYLASSTTFNVRGAEYRWRGTAKTYTPGSAIDPVDNDTTYIWMEADNTIGYGVDGDGWPTTDHLPLAEIDVDSDGVITAVRDKRGQRLLAQHQGITVPVVVASADASDQVKGRADYVCDGTADQVEINAAIQSLTSVASKYSGTNKTGGWVQLSEGEFHLSSPIVVDRGIRLSGVTGGTTVIYLDNGADCHCVKLDLNDFASTVPLSIIEHMEIYGNDGNQTANVADQTGVTGTDATPTVLTKAGAFSSFASNGLVGRKVWIKSGTNATAGLYEITANDADTLTLNKNASSGGAISDAVIRVEGIAGVYVESIWSGDDADGQIDLRVEDVWFDNINGPAISLGHYWNHKIHKCTFEHSTGPAVEFRVQSSTVAPSNTNLYESMGLEIEGVIRMFGEGRAKGVVVHDCRFNQISKTPVEIPGEFFACHDCIFNLSPDADDTYNIFELDTDHRTFGCHHISIHDNLVDFGNTNDPKRFFYQVGDAYAPLVLDVSRNRMYSTTRGLGTAFVEVAGSQRCDLVTIDGNMARQHTAGTMIQVASGYKWLITHNTFVAASGSVEMEITDAMQNFIIANNALTRGITVTSTHATYPPKLLNNIGFATEGHGVATITNPATTVVVTHGLGTTPTQVLLTPQADPADDLWVTSIGATEFTINIGTTPGASLDIMWSAKVAY